ncbi:MAG: biopolymer transport protein ExbD [Planctomycetota bacterium]|jgi:biopolymer transport protein ExbD
MFQSVRNSNKSDGQAVVDIAPLIDVVFILLIFFLVTTTFVKDTVLEVDRAEASNAQPTDAVSMRISVAASGAVYAEGKPVELDELARRVQRAMQRDDLRSVIVIPDRAVPAGRLIEVIDLVRGMGMENIALAAERRGN